jgi:hypothetical protein
MNSFNQLSKKILASDSIEKTWLFSSLREDFITYSPLGSTLGKMTKKIENNCYSSNWWFQLATIYLLNVKETVLDQGRYLGSCFYSYFAPRHFKHQSVLRD